MILETSGTPLELNCTISPASELVKNDIAVPALFETNTPLAVNDDNPVPP